MVCVCACARTRVYVWVCMGNEIPLKKFWLLFIYSFTLLTANFQQKQVNRNKKKKKVTYSSHPPPYSYSFFCFFHGTNFDGPPKSKTNICGSWLMKTKMIKEIWGGKKSYHWGLHWTEAEMIRVDRMEPPPETNTCRNRRTDRRTDGLLFVSFLTPSPLLLLVSW